MPCAHRSQTESSHIKLWLNENKNEAEISTWAFPLDRPSKDQGPGICFGAGSPSINPIIISLS